MCSSGGGRATPLVPVCVLFLALGASAVGAEGWGEPHLPIVPRTAEDTERVRAATAQARDFTAPEAFEAHPAGAATRSGIGGRDAFSFPSANMAFERELDFQVGNGLFKKLWVTAPASTQSSDGLGPLFNARSCQSCHIRDGRGHPPDDADDTGVSLVVKLSIPAGAPAPGHERRLENLPEPVYGRQLQDKSLAGIDAEARIAVTYEPVPVTLGDGTVIALQKPRVAISRLAYGAIHPQAQLSARVAPQMIGLGLLEAVPEADILAWADPEDADGDGISGRPNVVWSDEFDQWILGRFGHKAGSPTLRAQSAAAFRDDMGLSTSLHPEGWGDCTADQLTCRAAPTGNGGPENLEVASDVLDLITFYSRNLAVPERRNPSAPQVLRGKALFHGSGCALCHRPKFVTHRLAGQPEQNFQLIWPYTDLLLHDMGDGLADHRPDWQATGREWRTPPLWGIGRTQEVSGHTRFLHDGRARTLLEAILWHGGEAEASREVVRMMPAPDRAALIAFLESL